MVTCNSLVPIQKCYKNKMGMTQGRGHAPIGDSEQGRWNRSVLWGTMPLSDGYIGDYGIKLKLFFTGAPGIMGEDKKGVFIRLLETISNGKVKSAG
jgi:hypothetical protein